MIWIIRIIVNALAVFLIAQFIPGIHVDTFLTAIWAGLLLGLINTFIKPVLTLLTLPLNILTLGLFTFILNAALFWLTSSLIQGFSVDGFIPAFIGALLMTVISWVINMVMD